MMSTSVILGLKVAPGPIHKKRYDTFDFNRKSQALKEEASKQVNIPTQGLNLVHHGRILEDEKSLNEHGVKPGEVVYVLKKHIPVETETPEEITDFEVHECVMFFRTFKNPAEMAVTIMLKIRHQGHSEHFISSHPLLANDPVAINFLREPELMAHMGDPDTIVKVATKHPAFMQAIRKIAAISEFKPGPVHRIGFPSLASADSDEEDIDLVVDPDDDIEDGNAESQQVSVITPEQLSSALALAGMAAGTNSTARSSTSSGSDSVFPAFRGYLESLLAGGGRATNSSPGTSRPIITTHALNNALSNISNNSANSSTADLSSMSSADPSVSSEDTNARKYAEQLLKMQEMGLTNNQANLNALVISDGDVNAAINFILSDS